MNTPTVQIEVQVLPQRVAGLKRLAAKHDITVVAVSLRMDPHEPSKHEALTWLSAFITVEAPEDRLAVFADSVPEDWVQSAIHADTHGVLEAAAAAARILGTDDPQRIGFAVLQAFGDDDDDPLDLFSPEREDVLHAAACRWEWLDSDERPLARAARNVLIPLEDVGVVAAAVALVPRQEGSS